MDRGVRIGNADAHAYTDANTVSDADSNSYTDANADSNPHADSDSVTDPVADTDANPESACLYVWSEASVSWLRLCLPDVGQIEW